MSHKANHIYFSCLIPVRIFFCVATFCCNNNFNDMFLSLQCFHISHWPNGLCHLGDDKCKEIARQVKKNVLMISSNTRCAGRQCLQLHDFVPSSFKTGRHSPWWLSTLCMMHLRAQLHRQLLFGICTGKRGSCWMNLSSCWPTTVWLQLLLCPYQLIVDFCNLFSCNWAVVLCTCWHITTMVAITIIVIVKWHWPLDAFNGLTTLIVALGVTLGICSCVTRMTQISGSTRLVLEVLCTFRQQQWCHCCFSSPPRATLGTRVDPCDDFDHKQGFHLVVLWDFKIGGNQCRHNLSLSQWVSSPLAIGSVNNLIVR